MSSNNSYHSLIGFHPSKQSQRGKSRSLRAAVLNRWLLPCAWAMWAVACFLPVARVGGWVKLGGWDAFRVAISPLWPFESPVFEGYVAVIATLTAFSNLVFLFSPLIFIRQIRNYRRSFGLAALIAFAVDAYWLYFEPSEGPKVVLRVGYFLWWLSFLMLAIAMFTHRRAGGKA